MKIGFFLKWPKGSLDPSWKHNVIGDELLANSICKAIRQQGPDIECDVYAPNFMPDAALDAAIYLNEMAPIPGAAKKSVIYLQNGGVGRDTNTFLNHINSLKFDGCISFSALLLDEQSKRGVTALYLPFGVDTETFYPRPIDPKLAFDVGYIGNDIKGAEATKRYLEPALKYNFGLFGNWERPHKRWKMWKVPRYKYKFYKRSQGKIPQEQVPVLYSSCKINLNCTLRDCVDWDVITLRTLEVISSGGFLISDRVPSAEKMLGNFMVFTDGGRDLKRKITYYLSHPEERSAIASRGSAFVRENFSINATASKLIDYLRSI